MRQTVHFLYQFQCHVQAKDKGDNVHLQGSLDYLLQKTPKYHHLYHIAYS